MLEKAEFIMDSDFLRRILRIDVNRIVAFMCLHYHYTSLDKPDETILRDDSRIFQFITEEPEGIYGRVNGITFLKYPKRCTAVISYLGQQGDSLPETINIYF